MGRHARDPATVPAKPAAGRKAERGGVRLPALVILAWLAAVVLCAPMVGKLSEAQTNDNSAFLPASSESAQVSRELKAFSDADVLPAVAVFTDRGGSFTPQRLSRLAPVTDAVGDVRGLAGRVPPPVPSRDGRIAQLVVPIDGADATAAAKTAQRVRGAVDASTPRGMDAYLTGPGGYAADTGAAFAGIDGRLLLVTAVVVAAILVLVYRSPLLPVVVLCSAAFALVAASAVTYPLAHSGILTLNGQTQGILFILVFGAATDYALLLVARYREELRHPQPLGAAMRAALRRCVEPIGASGGTVIAGMLCMLVSELTSNAALGPVGAVGIAASLLASLTFLPAVLMLLGRAAFWPTRPAPRGHRKAARTLYTRVADLVGRRARPVWVLTALALLAGVAFAPQLKADGVAQRDLFLQRVDAVAGQDILAAHGVSDTGSPAEILADRRAAPRVVDAAQRVPGIAGAAVVPANPADPRAGPAVADGDVHIRAKLAGSADSQRALDTVRSLRAAVHRVPGADAHVGGQTASTVDVQDAASADRQAIVPIVLGVIFVILALLLRALVAPLLLIATVVLSYGATLGVGALVFNDLLGYPGSDPAVPLYAFVFLVALGIDYNIFLMTRVREETLTLGTRGGTLRGLSVTGGVITSAGVVLAATFAALAVLPILFMVQIAFLVAFGVLLDTLVVRSLLVPALAVDAGRFIWWPSRLARRPRKQAQRRSSRAGADRPHPGTASRSGSHYARSRAG